MKSYNAKDFVVTFGNIYITGLGETMSTGEKDEDFFSTSVGAQGDVEMSEINNPLGTVTITLQATSPQKAYLMECAKSGAVLPLWATNKSIGERYGGTQARITKYPTLEEAAEAGEREFTFTVFDYTVEPTE